MLPLILITLIIACSCDTLNVKDKQDVKKREINNDFFPNWVPFKNKHGDELGEFIDVNKPKPKKRLALPANFILKSVAQESDDYYDKNQDEDSDYFEKKDWSNTNRPAETDDTKRLLSPSNISDIDGIVNIITKKSYSPILKALSNKRQPSRPSIKETPKRQNIVVENMYEGKRSEKNEEKKEKKHKENKDDNQDNKTNEENNNDKEVGDEENENVNKDKEERKNRQEKDAEKDEIDEEESSSEKRNEEAANAEEQRQNEEKKARILSSVDELKERHAKEQQSISEKLKEEEMFKDDLDRELERTGDKRHGTFDKYGSFGSKWKKNRDEDSLESVSSESDSSEEDVESEIKNKYDVIPYKALTTTSKTTPKITSTKTDHGRRNTLQRSRQDDTTVADELSVFKNPNLYTINDDVYETTTVKVRKTKTKKPQRFSSRYKSSGEDNDRIYLVAADDSKEGEPALFFPKKRQNKRKFKIKVTTPTPHVTADLSQETSSLTEVKLSSDSSEINTKGTGLTERGSSGIGLLGTDPSGTDLSVTGPSDADPSASNTAPSDDIQAPDTTASGTSDLAQASTNEKEKKKDENYHREKGGKKEHHVEHDDVHEEHGKKAYEGIHKDTKTNKGHHDKEDHLDKYNDHGGIDKHHDEQDNQYGSHHHEEHGKKHAKYEESGKHSKGHNTKGSHDIHKKEEYEKKVEFFEEDGDSDDEEHDGGYHSEKDHSSGGHFKKGNFHAGHEGHSKGETGHFLKGGHGNQHKGHRASGGHDSHAKHGGSHHKSEGQANGKKWMYHHGHPAKNANLIIIDRRADAYQHGPFYYG